MPASAGRVFRPGIGILVNPAAGRGRDPRLLRRLHAVLGPRGLVAESRRIEDLPGILSRFRDSGVGLVAIAGGDGSNLHALTSASAVYGEEGLPPIAFLRGGTVNIVARGLGISGTPAEILEKLLPFHDHRVPYPEHMLRLLAVNQHLGFICGAAMPARFFQAYYQGHGRGLSKGARLAVRLVASAWRGGAFSARLFAPVPGTVEVDREVSRLRAMTALVVATVSSTPLGFRPCYRAEERLDRFHLVALCDPPERIAREARRLLRGKPLSCPTRFDRLGARAAVRFERPEPYLVDGELFEADTLRIGLGPVVRVVRILE